MKTILALLVIGAFGYLVYERIARQPELPAPEEPPQPMVTETHHTQTCSTCRGRGTLIRSTSRGAQTAYACPICNERGSVEHPVGVDICDHCNGFGNVERRTSRLIQSQTCPLCHGRGIRPQRPF